MKPNSQKIRLVTGWLKKAESDYQIAKTLSNGDLAFYDDACFHCQQAVEKILKAVSIYHSGSFTKVYDLKTLVDDVKKIGFDPNLVKEEVDRLDAYYTGVRYLPDVEKGKEDAVRGIAIVEKVKRFVENEAGLEEINFDKNWWESV